MDGVDEQTPSKVWPEPGMAPGPGFPAACSLWIRPRTDGNPTRQSRAVRPVAGWLLPLMGAAIVGAGGWPHNPKVLQGKTEDSGASLQDLRTAALRRRAP